MLEVKLIFHHLNFFFNKLDCVRGKRVASVDFTEQVFNCSTAS